VRNRDGDSFEKARQYAFLLLRYRDRSEKEIVQRLQKKGFSEEIGFKVRDYLKDSGFIADVKFAASLKRTGVEQKCLGRVGVFRYLISKGIPAEMAGEIAGEDSAYEDSAVTLVKRKMKQYAGLDDEVVKRRLWATLARKGYSAEVIKRALRSYYDTEEFCS
jgi:regulatory protein